METVRIIYRGEGSSKRIIRDKKVQEPTLTMPFIGFDEKDKTPYGLGFGFMPTQGQAVFFTGHSTPITNLIQCWRAVKIIENLSAVSEDIISSIWNVASGDEIKIEQSLEFVSPLYLGEKPFTDLLETILHSGPSNTDLDYMLKLLISEQVSVDLDKIEFEIKCGAISGSDYFSELKIKFKIPDAIIPVPKRKRILDDFELDDMIHEFHTVTPIMEKPIINPAEDYLAMYKALENLVGLKTAQLLMYIYVRNEVKDLIATYTEDQAKVVIIKMLQRYKIL